MTLERRTPLQRVGLKRGTTRMSRTKRVKPQSQKRADDMLARRQLVADLLARFPVCQMAVVCQGARSVDVDEIKSRAAGGDFLDPDNCQAVCRACHSWKHEHPEEAHRMGFTRFSWE